MCGSRRVTGTAEALAALDEALGYLCSFDAASVPAAEQAEVLRGLERVESRHTVARARVLGAFAVQGGPERDGQQSAGAWLRWQTRVTAAAAAGAVAWARRLAAHPVVGRSMASGEMSPSWARQVCAWTDRLPEEVREDADRILAGAACGGATLPDLAVLAEEMRQRSAPSGGDGDDGFEDRYFRLGITFGGAGRAEGDLAPECAAALSAVLEALGKKAGPEDVRSAGQRRHDALAEACRRLIAAGLLPARAGQPTQVQVHMSLAQLRLLPGAAEVEAAWLEAAAAQPGWLSGPAADAAACDATMVPVVTGQVDWAALDLMAETFLAAHGIPSAAGGGTGDPDEAEDQPGSPAGAAAGGAADAGGAAGGAGGPDSGPSGTSGGASGTKGGAASGAHAPGPAPRGAAGLCRCACDRCPGHHPPPGAHRPPLPEATRQRLRRALLALAVQALSGPGGLAATLRANLDSAPLTTASLPLDIGAATETIPAHLRRAAAARHPHCAFPGCWQPAATCDIHHLIPRSRGGPTALANLAPVCLFHHLVVIHRWGWTLTLNPDGTTTATSPDGRAIGSHDPPPSRAA